MQARLRRFRTSSHLCVVTSFESSKIGRGVGKERAELIKQQAVMLRRVVGVE
jgi:hypothetical protein